MNVLTQNMGSRLTISRGQIRDEKIEFARDLRRGLSATPKYIPSRYFYDAQGSHLFEQICELPEYYPTRTEDKILQDHVSAILDEIPTPVQLVELGAGSSTKTRTIITGILQNQEFLSFYPIDISQAILEISGKDLLTTYDQLSIQALAMEYNEGLEYVHDHVDSPRFFLWLGSSIGNFSLRNAREFLQSIRKIMAQDDRLLVGIDLVKDKEILEQAYNDTQGITAQFNLNILERINREFDANFELEGFEHRALWNPDHNRIEMYLQSVHQQSVIIRKLDMPLNFSPGESILTEYSYKYRQNDITGFMQTCGFDLIHQWVDPRDWFSLNLLAL